TANPLSSGTIVLGGGVLQLRNNGDGLNTAQTLAYGNNIVGTGNATIDLARTSGTASSKTLTFGTMSNVAGTTLTLQGTNNYAMQVTNLNIAGSLTVGTLPAE